MSQGYIHFESERHAQPELYVPWKVDLIWRDLAETARIDANLWGAVDRGIKDIECLDPKLCREAISGARVLKQCECPLRLCWIADVTEAHVQCPEVVRRNHSPGIAPVRTWVGGGAVVEPPVKRLLSFRQLCGRLPQNRIRRRSRRARLDFSNDIDLPSIGKLVCRAGQICTEAATTAERKIVQRCDHQTMCTVRTADRSPGLCVESIVQVSRICVRTGVDRRSASGHDALLELFR